MKGPLITPEIMTKIWKLHGMGVDGNTIAETLGISVNSVRRAINIMTTAQKGGDVDSVDGSSYQKQKAFAKKMFGIEDEEKHEEKPNTDDMKDFMQRVILALAWQNELLEQLLAELGVDWRNKCKGVERR